jgi:hypothetical protein
MGRGKGIKKRPRQLGPQTDQDKVFCERWLHHFDKDRAYREAGYTTARSAASRLSLAKLKKFADYLRPIQEAKAKVIAERLAIDDEAVLQGMVKRVFYDPTEFYEMSEKPLTEWVKEKGAKQATERTVEWHGKPVFAERLKPYSELTAEQRAVVEITSSSGDRISYRLPTIREQHLYLTSLGRQYGMFAEKLIVERHSHKHTHHTLEFQNVPTGKLHALTRQMLPLVGLEFAQRLGFTAEDVEKAALEEGVIAVQEKTSA